MPWDRIGDETAEMHLKSKWKHGARRERFLHRRRRLYRQVMHSGGWKPSIYCHDDGRIRRKASSRQQQWMKRLSNRIIRRQPIEEPAGSAGRYRKYYDYWWIWF